MTVLLNRADSLMGDIRVRRGCFHLKTDSFIQVRSQGRPKLELLNEPSVRGGSNPDRASKDTKVPIQLKEKKNTN